MRNVQTASQYATINSTAFIAKVLPNGIDDPVLVVVLHDGTKQKFTNLDELLTLMDTAPSSDVDAVPLLSGGMKQRDSTLDNIPDQQI